MSSKIYGKKHITMQFNDENMNIVNHILPYKDIFTDSAHLEFLKYLEENNNNLNSNLAMFCLDKNIELKDLINYGLLVDAVHGYLNIFYTLDTISNIPSIQLSVYTENISIKKIFAHKYFYDDVFKVINIQTLPELIMEINMENALINIQTLPELIKEINMENAMINTMMNNML